MAFSREINRLLGGLLLAFGLMAATATFYAVVGPSTLAERQDNPRIFEAEAAILRGSILDRNGVALAETHEDGAGGTIRRYDHRAADSALGYYSLRFGVGRAEAAFDSILRGDDIEVGFSEDFTDRLLHRPQEGSDVRLTLDIDVQQALADSIGARRGAGVVLAVPSGEVLALVSLPSFDANTLDADWDALISAPGNPFFNRALQGNYQPGGALQTPLMAAALLANVSPEAPFENASAPVRLRDGLEIGCAAAPPGTTLTLSEAYVFGCPAPFRLIADQLGPLAIENVVETFRLDAAPTLPGFVPDLEDLAEQAVPAETPVTVDPMANALGQGNLTVTPLGMAVMMAGIANQGNAPLPSILLETRAPDAEVWQAASRPATIPVTTEQTARLLRDLMRAAVTLGAAGNAAQPGIDLGGHAAMAFSGEGAQAWFVGFARLEGPQSVVVAVVLEDDATPGDAAIVGGAALRAAFEAAQV